MSDIDEQPQDQHGRESEQRGEHHRVAQLQVTGGQGPAAGARHLLVDAAVQHVIEGGGGSGCQRNAESAEQQSG